MTVSCFVFGVQYVCRLTGKAKPEVKLFGVLGRRAEERERHPGLLLTTQSRVVFVHFKVHIGRIHINLSFSLHAMSLSLVYNAFLGVVQRECPNS